MRLFFIFMFSVNLIACNSSEKITQESDLVNPEKIEVIPELHQTTGSIEILHPDALKFIDKKSTLTLLANHFKWTEGPLWVDDGNESYLLFSDIPNNKTIKYQPTLGFSTYLDNSGTSNLYPDDYISGSNGLLQNNKKQLVVFQQGDRRISIMDAPLHAPQNKFNSLVSHYQNKRLNSPNDGVFHSNGSLYFTDPPYGLKEWRNDPKQELAHRGVYQLTPQGELILLDDSLTYPNGIAFSLDEKTLYVAVSDEKNPKWVAYDVLANGKINNKRVFYDTKPFLNKKGEKGLPDGMVLHSSGSLFASGPGGVWLFSPNGKVIAKIKTGKLTANCTLSSDEKTLFITAHNTLMSFPIK